MANLQIDVFSVKYDHDSPMEYHSDYEFNESLKERPLSTIIKMYNTCSIILTLTRQGGETNEWEVRFEGKSLFTFTHESNKDFLDQFKEELLKAVGLYDNDSSPDAEVSMG